MFTDFINVLRGTGTIAELVEGLIASLTIVFLVLPFHEFAHGFIAKKLGDPTADRQGRITLNPLAHIDIMGSALIVFFGFGWAKPVPVNPNYFKNPKKGMAITALAGPVANLIAAIAGGILLALTKLIIIKCFYTSIMSGDTNLVYTVMLFLLGIFNRYISINICLAVFNLIPFPPLDGSRIVGAFLPDSTLNKLYKNEQIFFLILVALMFSGIFGNIIQYPVSLLYNAITWITELPFTFFM